jgi:predicted AAA+ superfamily ATPase
MKMKTASKSSQAPKNARRPLLDADSDGEIPRAELLGAIANRLKNNPVVLLLGPRQCGKTTIARQFASAFSKAKKPSNTVAFFDLERPADQRRLSEPMTALESLRGLVIIDEAQLQPALFPVLRVLADRKPLPARFLLLGSASPDLIRGSSETLAGRATHMPMSGFSLDEILATAESPSASADAELVRRLWWRGGFPKSYLAPDDETSRQWRDDFILTFVERDLRSFGVEVAPLAMRRFWNMAAHYHGQVWNASDLAKSLGVAHTTTKRHLDILCEAFVMRQLPPWFENISKRQIKSPKVYLRDSGLLHNLLGAGSFAALESHPKLGASWEGFALEEVLRITGDREAYFWATQSDAELDLLVHWRGRRYGFEFKYGDAPSLTKSMHTARATLNLERLFVIYPGTEAYPLPGDWAEALPLTKTRERLMREKA